MARSALAQLMRDIEKRIIRRTDAETKARELIASGDVTAIADMIQENDRLKHVKKDWRDSFKYTMACKRVIARHKLTYELIDETEKPALAIALEKPQIADEMAKLESAAKKEASNENSVEAGSGPVG